MASPDSASAPGLSPATASEKDDGLLTASEVAGLKLNADWVVLSACNTAAGDKPGAEALSGLAKAFFYAGTRALLVSHWPVEDVAGAILVTRTFKELADNPAIGRAEALRRRPTGSGRNATPLRLPPVSAAPARPVLVCPRSPPAGNGRPNLPRGRRGHWLSADAQARVGAGVDRQAVALVAHPNRPDT